MKRLLIILGLLPILGMVVSCGKKHEDTVAEAIRVKTLAVAPTSVSGSRIYSGTVEESNSSALSFGSLGTVKRMYVSAGDKVSKGQLIAELDATSLQNAYEIAKATLDDANDAYNRMKQLHDSNSLADMKWVEVQNGLRQAQSAEAIARKALDDARLYAPYSGYIAEKFVDAGMNAGPGIPVVKLVAINPVKVSVSVPESDLGSIAAGQEAAITVKALGDKPFTGKLIEKGVTANILTRNYEVKFAVDNNAAELLPGMICDVAMVAADSVADMAIVLPIQSVLLDAGNANFVWLAIDGKATKRMVDVKGMTDDGLIISAGVTAGDSVIVAGQQKVSEGTKLEIIK